MDRTIGCPACKAAITAKQLFWTVTLLRFTCPSCATRIQPTDVKFATSWLIIAGLLGAFVGLAAVQIPGIAPDPTGRGLAYVGLVVLTLGGLAVIKWRTTLALIRKGELKAATR